MRIKTSQSAPKLGVWEKFCFEYILVSTNIIMTRLITTFLLLTLFIASSWGQKVSVGDSLKIMTQVDSIFKLFVDPDFSEFEKISTTRIYCTMCFDKPDFKDDRYMLDRKLFFDSYLKDIGKSNLFNRATKKIDILFITDNNRWSDFSVFFTVYQKDELANGHEGGQLGLYFKRHNSNFKFSGIETIP